MLLNLLKKMRCKHLMRVADLCRGSVSKLNGGGYRPEVVENTTFIRLKVPTRSTKTVEE
jgi:hypothetical protein